MVSITLKNRPILAWVHIFFFICVVLTWYNEYINKGMGSDGFGVVLPVSTCGVLVCCLLLAALAVVGTASIHHLFTLFTT